MIKGFSIHLFSVLLGAVAVVLVAGIRAFIRRSGKSTPPPDAGTKRAPEIPQKGIDPAVVAAIIAAISDMENRPFRIHRIRYLAPSTANEAWQELGRAQLLITRQVGRKV